MEAYPDPKPQFVALPPPRRPGRPPAKPQPASAQQLAEALVEALLGPWHPPATVCVMAAGVLHRLDVAGGKGPPPFVPTAFQKGILHALQGRALRSDSLGEAVRDRRRLFRHPGGLEELRAQGLVSHHPRLGYYRPDAPPPELADKVPTNDSGEPR